MILFQPSSCPQIFHIFSDIFSNELDSTIQLYSFLFFLSRAFHLVGLTCERLHSAMIRIQEYLWWPKIFSPNKI